MESNLVKNILFVSSYPFPLDKGAFQHAYVYLKTLAAHFNVYGVFFLPADTPQPSRDEARRFLGEMGIRRYEFCRYADGGCRKRFLGAIEELTAFPYLYMKKATHAEGAKIINEFIRTHSIDIVHFESLHYTGYVSCTPRHVKKVVVYHDLHHLIDLHHIRFERSYFNRLVLLPFSALKKYIYQLLLEDRIDLKIFLNCEEMSRLPRNSVHVPHVVNPQIRYREPEDKASVNILFLGGYCHPPNRASFRFLVDEVLPELMKKTKRFSLQIVGNGTEKFAPHVLAKQLNGLVRIKGFVPDINDVFAEVDIALFPILYGGGIKTKVIEAMAAGIPVVTTPQGVYGLKDLPPGTVGIGRSRDELIAQLILLMDDPSLRVERSTKGKEYIERNHSMEQLEEKLVPIYAGL